MNIIINKEMDKIYETMSLLAIGYNKESFTRESFSSTLSELGLADNKMIDAIFTLQIKYIDAFCEKMVLGELSDFFGGGQGLFWSGLHKLILAKKEWLSALEGVSDEEIFAAFSAEEFGHVPKDAKEAIQMLQKEEWGAEYNWRFLLFMENPKYYLEELIKLLNQNFPAFEYAKSVVQAEIDKRMENFELACQTMLESEYIAPFRSMLSEEEIKVIPSFMNLLGAVTFDGKTLYIGLEVEKAGEMLEKRNLTQDKLLSSLKALGDPSKFEILNFLRQQKSYNLEIANHLGLTPATTTHHMNMLLNMDLVKLEKVEKKVLYTINEEQVKKIVNALEETFLNRE